MVTDRLLTGSSPEGSGARCLAIGAATSPPVASLPKSPPFSTITATAYRGASAGANAMNHACGFSPFDAGLRGAGLARHRDALAICAARAGALLDDLRPSCSSSAAAVVGCMHVVQASGSIVARLAVGVL